MKVTIEEYNEAYSIDFVPESLADVNTLLRLQMNARKAITSIDSYATKTSGVATSVVIPRTKSERSFVK